jgi:hypothetical protein
MPALGGALLGPSWHGQQSSRRARRQAQAILRKAVFVHAQYVVRHVAVMSGHPDIGRWICQFDEALHVSEL